MKAGGLGGNTWPVRCIGTILSVLAVLSLVGCSTYYGYSDITKEVLTPLPDGAPRGVRHYVVLTAQNGNVSLQCFKRGTLPKNTLKETRIVGRKEHHRDYDAWYYLDNDPYIAGWHKDKWALSGLNSGHVDEKGKYHKSWFFVVDLGKSNPLYYLVPVAGQVGLAWDAVLFAGGACIDSCLFIVRCCWTGVSIPCAWLWGRTVSAFTENWHLAEHKPGVLRMISYMPFINFFMLQTPPYMTTGSAYGEKILYQPDDQPVLSRTRIEDLYPTQDLYPQCKVLAGVSSGGISYGTQEFRTDDDGKVVLTDFLRECLKAAPFDSRHFTLSLRLFDGSGHEVVSRKVDFAPEHVMSAVAANDLAAYRNGGTDCLNRLLLSRRSHTEWRRKLFADDLALSGAKK